MASRLMTIRSPLLFTLLRIGGCAPESGRRFSEGGEAPKPYAIEGWYQDYFTPTYALCGEPTGFQPYTHMVSTSPSDPEPVLLVSQECQDALLADLKVDWEQVAAYDDFDKVVFASTWISVYALLAWPMGTVDELRSLDDEGGWSYLLDMLMYYDHSKTPPFLREPLIVELEQLSRSTGETRVNALLYNMVMSSVLRTSFVLPEGVPSNYYGMTDIDSRTLYFGRQTIFGNLDGTTVLVHEMTHLWLDQRHVTCPALAWPSGAEGLAYCDDTWEGPWGYEVGTAWLMALHHDWDLEDPDDAFHWACLSYWLENDPYLILEP